MLTETPAINGPFVLSEVDGLTRYGKRAQCVQNPLRLAAIGCDGRAPHDTDGKTIAVRVDWRTLPDQGDAGQIVESTPVTDQRGRAHAIVRLGPRLGVCRVRASLPDYPDSRDLVFRALSEGVPATVTAHPVPPVQADRPCRVVVTASDWTGRTIRDAHLHLEEPRDFPWDRPVRARRLGAASVFTVRSRIAGTFPITIRAATGGASVQTQVTFVPGPLAKLALVEGPPPRAVPPYNHAKFEVRAADRFGNTVPASRTIWRTTSGKISPTAPEAGGAAAATLTLTDAASTLVSARCGARTVRRRVALPDVYLRMLEPEPYTPVGELFHVQLEVFPPRGAGVVKSLHIRLRQPDSAEMVSVDQPCERCGIPRPAVSALDNGRLDLRWDSLQIDLASTAYPLVMCTIGYRCTSAGLACVACEQATMVAAHSPDEPHALNPGTEQCRLQKWLSSKRLCLNICIVAGDSDEYETLLARTRRQVKYAQKILDDNIGVCCPDIDIKACYHQIDYGRYKAGLTDGGGDRGDELKLFKPMNQQTTNPNDPTQDVGNLSDDAQSLLAGCRKPECLTVTVVPGIQDIDGDHLGGYTIQKSNFPQAVVAPGAGPAIFLFDYASDPGCLVHELGHALMDTRGKNHTNDPDRVMAGGKDFHGNVGTKFIKEECSKIFDNIGRFGGDCET